MGLRLPRLRTRTVSDATRAALGRALPRKLDGEQSGWPAAIEASAQAAGVSVRVRRALEGRSGDPAFMVDIGGGPERQQAFFKVFLDPQVALRDTTFLQRLADLDIPNYHPVQALSLEPLVVNGVEGTALLMEPAAGGRTLGRRLTTLPPASIAARAPHFAALAEDLEDLGQGLASAHRSFESGEFLTLEAKDEIINRVRSSFDKTLAGRPALTDRLTAVRALAEPKLADFRQADLRATVPHNDAHLGNFLRDQRGIRVIDVSTMANSVTPDGKASGAGENDVGRLLQSLVSWPGQDGKPALTPAEVARLQSGFLTSYARERGVDLGHLTKAAGLQRIQFELAVLRFSKTDDEALGALDRLEQFVSGS